MFHIYFIFLKSIHTYILWNRKSSLEKISSFSLILEGMHIKFEDSEKKILHKRVRNLESSISYFTVTEAIRMKTLPDNPSKGFRRLSL